ncbi:MAG: hypothetical protein WCS72_15440, partial [Deltaproteobacteria bacterium]
FVEGEMGKQFGNAADPLPEGVEDVAFISLRYPNHVLGHIQVSWLDPKKLREIVVVGDKKMVIWDELAPAGPITIYDKTVVRQENYEDFGQFQLLAREGDITIPKVRLEEPLKVQSRFFLKCVGEGRLPMGDGTFAVDVVKVLEAIEKSLQSGGAPALVARHARHGARVLVIGAGKSGALVCAQAKETLAGSGEVVAADVSEAALAGLRAIGVVDRTLPLDATRGVEALQRVESAGGLFDLVVNCANVPNTELSTLLLVRDGGTVIFFSMATSFTAAALGAEGVGKDATLLIGNGYVPGHADLALGLLRRNPRLRAHFEAKFLR